MIKWSYSWVIQLTSTQGPAALHSEAKINNNHYTGLFLGNAKYPICWARQRDNFNTNLFSFLEIKSLPANGYNGVWHQPMIFKPIRLPPQTLYCPKMSAFHSMHAQWLPWTFLLTVTSLLKFIDAQKSLMHYYDVYNWWCQGSKS